MYLTDIYSLVSLSNDCFWVLCSFLLKTIIVYVFFYVCFSGEKYQVLDSCSRSMLRTEDLEDQGQMLACAFVLKLLENQEDREVSYMLKSESMWEHSPKPLSQRLQYMFALCTNGSMDVYRSDKLRWIYALTPNRRTRFISTSTHQQGTSHIMRTHPISHTTVPWVWFWRIIKLECTLVWIKSSSC